MSYHRQQKKEGDGRGKFWRRKFVLLAIAVVLIVMDVVVAIEGNTALATAVGNSISVLLLLAIYDVSLDAVDRIDANADDRSSDLSKAIKGFTNDNRSSLLSTGVLNDIQELTEVDWIDTHLYRINNPGLAIATYLLWWERLIKLQLTGRQLRVRAIHSTGVDLWVGKDYRIPKILALHREFVNAGGTIHRVLIGAEPLPSTQHLNTVQLMEEHGVHTIYLPRQHLLANERITWDFLLAGVKVAPWQDEAVIWDAEVEGGLPNAAEFVTTPWRRKHDLNQYWDDCISALRKSYANPARQLSPADLSHFQLFCDTL
ncbi:MAG: hypothetical protein GC161_06795 [Planctomycetaceae bacterium]|nr:hypothetical protein [Planctomycetaceae bacterium]